VKAIYAQRQQAELRFDAYLKRQGSPDVLCDVRLWLPSNASEDMRISVFAPGTQNVDSLFSQEPLTLKSETYQEFPTFEVIASGAYLKEYLLQRFREKHRAPRLIFFILPN